MCPFSPDLNVATSISAEYRRSSAKWPFLEGVYFSHGRFRRRINRYRSEDSGAHGRTAAESRASAQTGSRESGANAPDRISAACPQGNGPPTSEHHSRSAQAAEIR